MKRGRIITIGSFDGVHQGHAALLDFTVKAAKKRKLKSAALTFEIPPRIFLQKKFHEAILSNQSEKKSLIRSHHIDEVVTLRFDNKMSRIQPFLFFRDFLIRKFQAKGIVVGHDFRFGMDRSAGGQELVRWGLDYCLPVWVIPPVRSNGKTISSSQIRDCFKQNQIKTALRYLGHPYLISGKVVKGQGIGKKLGFPTANLKLDLGKILPRGVFIVRGWFGNNKKRHYGVCNIGKRPTITKKRQTIVEVHLFDKTAEMLGRTLTIELHHRLRSEKRFSSFLDLQRAIAQDVSKAKMMIRNRKSTLFIDAKLK